MAKRTSEPTQTIVPPTPKGQGGASMAERKPIAWRVFIWCATSGPRGATECLAIHEVALAKRRAESMGEKIDLLHEWHDGTSWSDRERPIFKEASNSERSYDGTITLNEEHERLTNRFSYPGADGKTINLMADVYGPPHQGRLLAVIRRIHLAGRAMAKLLAEQNRKLSAEDLTELVKLADPEADFADADEIEAPAAFTK